MHIIAKIGKSIIYILMSILMARIAFDNHGWMAVGVSVYFFILGVLLSNTWKGTEKEF